MLVFLLACATPESADHGHDHDHAEEPAPVEPAAAPGPVEPAAPADAAVATPRVNLNTATKAELEGIPGMTPKMVHEFEEYRPYVSISQFRKQIGKYVSAEQVTQWEPYVYVPIAFNDCDEATLMQLDGVDAGVAGKLVAKRPYADQAAFLAELGALVTPERAAAGAALLK